jgi:elongation factor Ts
MSISTTQIRELRERTGAGILDAKNALVASGGDVDAAIDSLRKKGLAKAAKKATREAGEGRIVSYIHGDPGRIGVLIEVNCETDFVARTEAFQQLCHGLAMHVAAAAPEFVRDEDVPAEAVERERGIYRAEMAAENKPAEIMERILDGKLQKWMDERVLLRQPYIRDDSLKVGDMVQHSIADLGENIVVRRFARFDLAEKV